MRISVGGTTWTAPSGQQLWLNSRMSGTVAGSGTWADQSGNGNDFTLGADAEVTTYGLQPKAASYPYINPLLSEKGGAWKSSGFCTTDVAFTICMWAYREIDIGSDDLGKRLFRREYSAASKDLRLYTWSETQAFYFYAYSTNGPISAAISKQEWHHVAITVWNGLAPNRYAEMYVDGIKVDDYSTSSGWLQAGDIPWCFGTSVPNSSLYYAGRIDDIQVYNTVLTAENVLKVYKCPMGHYYD